MPLRDHFHSPLYPRRHWHSFHNAWACCISADLNRRLPEGYFAEANVRFGVEIDVVSFAEGVHSTAASGAEPWVPPTAGLRVPIATITDEIEVEVFSLEGGIRLAGAVELVSPAHKDRPETRDAFIFKCASYIQQGIGLVMVDVVTTRSANLHNELMSRLHVPDAGRLQADLYAVAYHPVKNDETSNVDLWPESLAVGRTLPKLPLWLRGGLVFPVDLEEAYERAWREQRLSNNGA